MRRWVPQLTLILTLFVSLWGFANPSKKDVKEDIWKTCFSLKKEHRGLAEKVLHEVESVGIEILQVADSKLNGMFEKWHEACWVRTNLGIFEVVFFPGNSLSTPVRTEKGKSTGGMAINYVTSPDGQRVEIQGHSFNDFIGPHVWLSSASQNLSEKLKQIKSWP